MNRSVVIFVTRDGCALCDELFERVVKQAKHLGVEVTTVDVDADADLLARFGHAVPVLMRAGGKVLASGRVSSADVWVALIRAKFSPK